MSYDEGDFIDHVSSTDLLHFLDRRLDNLLYNSTQPLMPKESWVSEEELPSILEPTGSFPYFAHEHSKRLKLDPSFRSTTFVSVELFHKPRGSRGLWCIVQPNDRLRVTKEKGKRLKLHVDCPHKIDSNKVNVYLVDVADPHTKKDGIKIESLNMSQNQSNVLEIELKLFVSLKKFQLSDHLMSSDGVVSMIGNTVLFSTSSSGGTNIQHDKGNSDITKRSFKELNSTRESPAVVPSSLDVYGFVRAKAFHQLSDVRLKTDIRSISEPLCILSKLEPKRYRWNNREKDNFGFIAQQVQNILPELVEADEQGLLSVNYVELVPILVEALKEQVRKADDIHQNARKELESLKDDYKKLQKVFSLCFWLNLVTIGLAVLLFCHF
eukprot:TRINITY_DN1549_c0_g2_i5.p1 TRINITY_DN1549_c0_g2~~TRINITY_DN1549_c0_g2_i5.p1  ORF type:complete len:381 (+),score=49.88 TRINITY_DN1549_c0_g2_i5:87-1229(+)